MKCRKNLRLISILLLVLVILVVYDVGEFIWKPAAEVTIRGGQVELDHDHDHQGSIKYSTIAGNNYGNLTSVSATGNKNQELNTSGTLNDHETVKKSNGSKKDETHPIFEKGPLLFDHTNGWNGTSSREASFFCNDIAESRRICPWNAYCPKYNIFGGIETQANHSGEELWAPLDYQQGQQPVLVSVGGINPCFQRGTSGESERINMPYILCCHEGEEKVVMNTKAEVENQTDLFINDLRCRNECHISNNNTAKSTINSISTPERYCMAKCRSVHQTNALSKVKDFFKTLPQQQSDLATEKANCIDNCQRQGNITVESLIPPPHQQYCIHRCRWMFRQKTLSILEGRDQNHNDGSLVSTLMKGRCSDISDVLRYDGVCKSLSHRQKPEINLILSHKTGKETDLGVRDCAASQCVVSIGPGHTDSSHVFLSSEQQELINAKKVNADQINVHIKSDQLLENKKTVASLRMNSSIDWTVSHSQDRLDPKAWIPLSNELLLCDICDKTANEVASAKWIWNMSLGLETVDQCLLDVLSRHTLPVNLPLINPSFGIDAVFVTNYTPLKDRRDVMSDRVREHFNADPVFIKDFDREELSDGDIECIGNREAQMAYVHRHEPRGSYSLTVKHAAAWFYIVEHSLDNVLVLEDDASFLHPDWIGKDSLWQEMLQNLPPDYDVLILCGEAGRFIKGKKISEHLFLGQHSRATDAYLISQKGARNLLRSLPMV